MLQELHRNACEWKPLCEKVKKTEKEYTRHEAIIDYTVEEVLIWLEYDSDSDSEAEFSEWSLMVAVCHALGWYDFSGKAVCVMWEHVKGSNMQNGVGNNVTSEWMANEYADSIPTPSSRGGLR
jgi:hypothetical protein